MLHHLNLSGHAQQCCLTGQCGSGIKHNKSSPLFKMGFISSISDELGCIGQEGEYFYEISLPFKETLTGEALGCWRL